MQRIPLVLETPSFELPETVWKTEIDVLNQLSEIELETEEGEVEENILQGIMKDVRSVVKDAEKANGKKGKETKSAGAKKGMGVKRRADPEDEGSDSDS